MSKLLRILILEDSPSDAELEVDALEEAGFECRWDRVEIQTEFLECLDGQAYDLILADYSLPTFDGLTALRLFLERDLVVPFILVSGTLGEETAVESVKAGATDYVLKDRLLRLGSAVERALHEREEQRQLRLAEEALRESEKKYRLLADNVSDVIWVLDISQLQLSYASPSVEQLQGYTPEELVQIPVHDFLTPQSLKVASGIISEELEKEKSETTDPFRSRTVELEQYCKNGSTVWVEVTASFIRDEEDKPIGILGVSRDISERKRANRERKRLEIQLYQAQKMEAIGALAGGIAHDFNNILSAIIGYTELALKDVQNGPSIFRSLQEVLKAGERAKRLVRQILTFSRQTEMEHKPVQVKVIAKEAINFLRASLPTTIEIRQEIRSDSMIIADPTQIYQVLMNLCTNAEHAVRDNGGILTIKLEDIEIDADFIADHPGLNPGAYLRLAVSDTGYGIPAHLLNRIFDPFFTTKEKGDGTGMGLSVVHGIVGSHGGIITAYNNPGQGATFEVYLPVTEKDAKSQTEPEKPIPVGTERILFIDDEPVLANLGKQILEHLGYDVTTRTSSIEALELFKAQPDRFDLVITDMTMPTMTGDELTRELMRVKPDIPVILCTGFSAKIDDSKAMAMGIRAFVVKPVLTRDIAVTIRNVLDAI